MSEEQIILSDITSGKKKVISRWEYMLNYSSLILSLFGLLVTAIFWFAEAKGRIFTDEEIKIKTENYIKNATELNGNEYVTRKEFNRELQKYYDLAKENRADIKEILKYLRK